ncbi:MAG TPA: hypothetical protein VGJ22_02685 [Anaerolineales bacterium]|jgi:hypothetical protein
MSSVERKRILKMVEDGKITAEGALTLIKAIDEHAAAEALDEAYETGETGPAAGSGRGASSAHFSSSSAPELERTAAQARRLAQIPLWSGITLVVLSASGMYAVMRNAGMNFWFYFLMVVLLLGVALSAFGAWSRSARWLFVHVEQSEYHEWPRRILLGLPLPLELAGWFLRTFGNRIEGLQNTAVDEVVQAISLTKGMHEPLIVNVEEGEGGERVQVYIG